ncbi:transcriptional protein SWT1 isoform X2 [Parambassis ranga]|uniref:Transcriptional protein SWT1 n=1 Tax=Parambassis ranga TaxID=210632 RepID=A0A6P7IIS6_9TELE|nr:transcriptional protein SWT1 isoform X2 [Parambassis ranga]
MSAMSQTRRPKLSSSSREEDAMESNKQDVTNTATAKGRHDVKIQGSCAKEQESVVSSTVKETSQCTRKIKKPVYRLGKKKEGRQEPVNKEEQCTKTKCVLVPLPGVKCPRKENNYITKNVTISGSKTVEKEHSKPLNMSASKFSQRTETPSKARLEEKSSQRSLFRSRQKRTHTSVEQSKTANASCSVKNVEPTSSSFKERQQKKRTEQGKTMCQSHHKNELDARTTGCTDSKKFCAITANTSYTSAKRTTSKSCSKVVKDVALVTANDSSMSHKTAKSFNQKKLLANNFKIPKKVHPHLAESTSQKKDVVSTKTNHQTHKYGIKPPDCGISCSKTKQDDIQAHSSLHVSPNLKSEGQHKRPSFAVQNPAAHDANMEPWCDQMQVLQELHQARSDKRLEINIMQRCGELTSMDIDLPEDSPVDSHCQQPPQQDPIIVLDTNILLSHLDYVKKIRSHGLRGLCHPVVLIPWVVLQELDSLKRGRGLPGSVAHLAIPAISYIYNSLKSREPRFWGQSMQQAAESCNGLNAENNDDRVLQCCLQYQCLYPESALILCTNDKNLCNKALLSGVNALSKSDLEAEVERHGLGILQNKPMLSTSCTPVQAHCQKQAGLAARLGEKEGKQEERRIEGDEEKAKWDLKRCVSELEDCLQGVLSDVLEREMKAVYEDIWQEIVYLKPPWTLQDILQCLKKHWIAVFGFILPRNMEGSVIKLINFFKPGEKMDYASTTVALQEAKEFVKKFGQRSSLVPHAISVMDSIFSKLHPQQHPSEEVGSSACDVVMNDDGDDDEKQPTCSQVSNQEVWAMFENIWSNVCKISLDAFNALGFDPHTTQSAHPMGGPEPPQDAMACLHRLSSMVSQLLQAFSSVLSSAPGLEEIQTLLSIIQCSKIVAVDSRLTANDLLECFSQPDYREKLQAGGTKLMELKQALDRCIQVKGQNIIFTT